MKNLLFGAILLVVTQFCFGQSKSYSFKLNGVELNVEGELIETSNLTEDDNTSLIESVYNIDEGVLHVYRITTTDNGNGAVMSAEVTKVPISDMNLDDPKIEKNEKGGVSLTFFTKSFSSSIKEDVYSDFMELMSSENMIGNIYFDDEETANSFIKKLVELQ